MSFLREHIALYGRQSKEPFSYDVMLCLPVDHISLSVTGSRGDYDILSLPDILPREENYGGKQKGKEGNMQ